MKNVLHILLYFLLLVLYATGVIGGFIALMCMKYWLLAIAVGFVGYMAFPKAREYFDKMMA